MDHNKRNLKIRKKTITDNWWNLNSNLRKNKRTMVGNSSFKLKEIEKKTRVGSSRSSSTSLRKKERTVHPTKGAQE
jgi:hypothetical protein